MSRPPQEPRRPLYDEFDRWSDAANAVSVEVQAALRPLFLKYSEAGYSVRQLSHIMMSDVLELEASTALGWLKPEREPSNFSGRRDG